MFAAPLIVFLISMALTPVFNLPFESRPDMKKIYSKSSYTAGLEDVETLSAAPRQSKASEALSVDSELSRKWAPKVKPAPAVQ